MQELACSENMRRYFSGLFQENERCYALATEARLKGLDPSTKVEIPQAEDLAARVEKQLSDWHVDGVAERIRELSRRIESREELSLFIAKELAKEAVAASEGREMAIERAVRVGLSVLTEGILVAPSSASPGSRSIPIRTALNICRCSSTVPSGPPGVPPRP